MTETPVFLLDSKKVKENFSVFLAQCKHLFGHKTIVAYSFKANDHSLVLKTALEQGYAAEVASSKELKKAISMKFDKIIFNSPVKPSVELNAALKYNGCMISVDNVYELAKINGSAKKMGVRQDILLRIDTQTIHSLNNRFRLLTRYFQAKKSKFGLAVMELADFMTKFDSYSNLNLLGINIHLGSQVEDPYTYNIALRRIPKKIKRLCNYIDIGGGYPSHSIERERRFLRNNYISSGTYLHELAKLLPDFNYILEPGRILVADTMHAIFTVHKIAGSTLVLDGGTNIIPYNLFKFKYPVSLLRSGEKLNINKEKQRGKKIYNLCGRMCYEEDYIAKKVRLPEVNYGDKIVFHNVGAYTYSINQNFNLDKPKVKLL